jgi:hypothetical protein
VFYHGNADALGPDRELLGRCRTEGISCCKHHFFPFPVELVCQLSDGGRFARTVHPHDEHNGGSAGYGER